MISDELVVHDGAAVPVPENRHGDAARIAGNGPGVDLMEALGAVDRIGDDAGAIVEGPSFRSHEPVHDGDGDEVFEALQRTENQRPRRPGAGKRDIKVIPARLSPEAAAPGGARAAIWRDPVPELSFGADEASPRLLSIVPAILPNTVHQQTHAGLSFISERVFRKVVRLHAPSKTVRLKARRSGNAIAGG